MAAFELANFLRIAQWVDHVTRVSNTVPSGVLMSLVIMTLGQFLVFEILALLAAH